jgi:hypothetical protein
MVHSARALARSLHRYFSASKGGQVSATSVPPGLLAGALYRVVRGQSGSNACATIVCMRLRLLACRRRAFLWGVRRIWPWSCWGNVMGWRRLLQRWLQGMCEGELPAVVVGEEQVLGRAPRMQYGLVPGVCHSKGRRARELAG